MLSFLFGATETPEQFEKRVFKALYELAAALGEPEEGEEQDAAYLRRFVVANDLDVAKAVKHVKEERAWRKKTFPLTLSEKEQEVFSSGRVRFLGINPDGVAVFSYDFMWGKFLDGFTADEIVNAQVHMAEDCIAKMKELAPQGPGRWTAICGGGPPPSEWSKKASAVFERYYPERLQRSLIYPVPLFMKKVVDAIIYWLPERTKAKFSVISTEEELRELANIPTDGPIQLPEDMLGGIDGARERDAFKREQQEGTGLDMSMMDEETRAALEKQAETDPELSRVLHGAKEDELYRLQMMA